MQVNVNVVPESSKQTHNYSQIYDCKLNGSYFLSSKKEKYCFKVKFYYAKTPIEIIFANYDINS